MAGSPDEHAPPRWPGHGVLAGCFASAVIALFWSLTRLNVSPVYARTIDQLLTDTAEWRGRELRVTGTLVPGSLDRTRCPVTFRLRSSSVPAELLVRYADCDALPRNVCNLPGMEAEVVAQGHLTEDATPVLEANSVLAFSRGKYEIVPGDTCAKMSSQVRACYEPCLHVREEPPPTTHD